MRYIAISGALDFVVEETNKKLAAGCTLHGNLLSHHDGSRLGFTQVVLRHFENPTATSTSEKKV